MKGRRKRKTALGGYAKSVKVGNVQLYRKARARTVRRRRKR